MRNLNALNAFRRTDAAVTRMYGSAGGSTEGVFQIPSPVDRGPLMVIASAGQGWDHVSVSRKNRTPNYTEMQAVYRLFFAEHETAMQLHVPPAEHVNVHPNCLHLWRPHDAAIPMPPSIMVGPKEAAE